MSKKLTIAIDFDGTIVEHKYPEVGKPIQGAINTILDLQKKGHRLMLWTMRSGDELNNAVTYLKNHGVELYGINENPQQKSWSQSTKQFAHLYIDDAALGCPLVFQANNERPYVDWSLVRAYLQNSGVL